MSVALTVRQLSDSLVDGLSVGVCERRAPLDEETPDYDPTNLEELVIGKVRDNFGGSPDKVEVGR